ncbi:MAG: lysophospholipid acyltransferase family protein [Candidatus Zixiibacteriota bacterium]
MKISHGFEFIGFWCLTKFVQLIPGWMADKLAAGIGILSYHILGSRRRIAIDNLTRAFSKDKSEIEIREIAREVFKTVARYTIDFSRNPVIAGGRLKSYVYEYSGFEYLTEALKEGRGVVFATAHFGNGEYMGGWLSAMGLPVDFVVGRQHNKHIDKMFSELRKAHGVGIIYANVSARHAIRALRDNRVIGLMADQHSASKGAIVNFFGRKAATPKGPASFCISNNCPMIFGVLIREKYNRYKILINPPIYPDSKADRKDDIVRILQEYTNQLEEIVRQYPEQWMWTHRRWKVDN